MPLATKNKPRALEPKARASYEKDFYSWALEQGALVRAGQLNEIDLENIAEEIESLGREQFSKLASFYRIILLHILKWDHQPSKRTPSWAGSIAVHRAGAEDVLEDNPGLKNRIDEAFARGYRVARLQAAKETGLPLRRFPSECPYSHQEMMERDITFEKQG